MKKLILAVTLVLSGCNLTPQYSDIEPRVVNSAGTLYLNCQDHSSRLVVNNDILNIRTNANKLCKWKADLIKGDKSDPLFSKIKNDEYYIARFAERVEAKRVEAKRNEEMRIEAELRRAERVEAERVRLSNRTPEEVKHQLIVDQCNKEVKPVKRYLNLLRAGVPLDMVINTINRNHSLSIKERISETKLAHQIYKYPYRAPTIATCIIKALG